MVLVAFWHGLRSSELVGIRRDDVQDGYLTVARLKGRLKTTQPLVEHPDKLLSERKALLEYVDDFEADARIFPISRQAWFNLFRKHCQAAEIPAHKSHPHVLKHTIAMQIIDKTGIQNTRQYLG